MMLTQPECVYLYGCIALNCVCMHACVFGDVCVGVCGDVGVCVCVQVSVQVQVYVLMYGEMCVYVH